MTLKLDLPLIQGGNNPQIIGVYADRKNIETDWENDFIFEEQESNNSNTIFNLDPNEKLGNIDSKSPQKQGKIENLLTPRKLRTTIFKSISKTDTPKRPDSIAKILRNYLKILSQIPQEQTGFEVFREDIKRSVNSLLDIDSPLTNLSYLEKKKLKPSKSLQINLDKKILSIR